MFCNQCGKEIADKSQKCEFCGAVFSSKSDEKPVKLICGNCGEENDSDKATCAECGEPLYNGSDDGFVVCRNCETKNKSDRETCVVCGTLLGVTNYDGIEMFREQPWEETENEKQSNPHKKYKKLAVLAIIVIIAFSWFNSNSGRLVRARMLVSWGYYKQAYDVASKAKNEDGTAYKAYASILRKTDYICEHRGDEDRETRQQELLADIEAIQSDKYLLKDEEQTKLDEISKYLGDYESLITSNLSSALYIYDRLEHYDNGYSWYAQTELETAESCEKALEQVIKYDSELCDFGDASHYLFYYTVSRSTIREAIDEVKSIMQDCIDEGKTGSRYYSKSQGFCEEYPNPYSSTEDWENLLDDISRVKMDKVHYILDGTLPPELQ